MLRSETEVVGEFNYSDFGRFSPDLILPSEIDERDQLALTRGRSVTDGVRCENSNALAFEALVSFVITRHGNLELLKQSEIAAGIVYSAAGEREGVLVFAEHFLLRESYVLVLHCGEPPASSERERSSRFLHGHGDAMPRHSRGVPPFAVFCGIRRNVAKGVLSF